jgi:hypothetical protein
MWYLELFIPGFIVITALGIIAYFLKILEPGTLGALIAIGYVGLMVYLTVTVVFFR